MYESDMYPPLENLPGTDKLRSPSTTSLLIGEAYETAQVIDPLLGPEWRFSIDLQKV